MANSVTRLATLANPNIKKVHNEFLKDQNHLATKTRRKYETVIELLESHINNYEYEKLEEKERELFEKYSNLGGKNHKDFCDLFGPDKIVPSLGMFLSYYMIRKVIAGEELKKAAGTVTKKLSKWLADKGYIDPEVGRAGVEEGAQAAKLLPNAEKAGELLFNYFRPDQYDLNDFDDNDYIEFDHFTISKVAPGELWFEYYDCDGKGLKTLGPITTSESITGYLQKGWDISCGFGRVKGKWKMVEVGNVYPN